MPEARSAYNRFYHDLLGQWQEAFAGHLTVYTYYMGMYAQRNLPYPQAEVICREWPALRAEAQRAAEALTPVQ